MSFREALENQKKISKKKEYEREQENRRVAIEREKKIMCQEVGHIQVYKKVDGRFRPECFTCTQLTTKS